MAVKITDLVDPAEIEKLKQLDAELVSVLGTYTKVATDLAKGIQIDVKVVGDIDKLENLLITKGKEAQQVQSQLTKVVAEQSQVLANTTNTISRHLMEQERVNKTQRDAYTEYDRVKKLLDQYHDTYEGQLQSLVKINRELEQNKKAQKDNEKALSMGRVTMEQFSAKQADLIAQHRSLTQEKRTLTQIMTAEEKASQSQEGSYAHLSQQLELLKKAYKNLSDEGRSSDFGKELEATIQNLDAHLKDVATDMGEFQRNVGNYAIAGQNGVATTDSVIAAMDQEAKTVQDLTDQTKILEEAKLLLDKNDANYQGTIDKINAKLEENKRKLSDVSDILGREAKTVSEAEAQNKRLSEAIKQVDLTSADAKKRIAEMREQIERNNKTIGEATGANEKLADSILGLVGVNGNFGKSFENLGKSGSFVDGLTTKIKALSKTLLVMLANPWVLAFLGIGGVAMGFKWIYNYNKGMSEASRLTQNFTGYAGEAADKVTTDMQAIADTLGKGYDETIGAANTLVQQFGVSWEEAMQLMQDGYVAGANTSGKMVDNIKQFAPALRDAGVSADEFMAILAETRNGIFSERGIQDIVKGGTRLRAMTKQIAESLDAAGISSKQMQKDLSDGTINMLEAVQQVSAKLQELPENSQEAGQIMKNVFGRTAAEGGTLLIQSIADVNTNLEVAKDRMQELGRVNNEQLNAQKELNETLASVFKMSGTSFEEMTTKAKTYVTQGLTKIIKGCVDIVNWVIRIYNKSILLRFSVNKTMLTLKSLWEISKFILNQIIDSLKAVGNILEGIFTMKWDKIQEGFTTGMKALGENAQTMAKNIANNIADAFNETVSGHLDDVTIGLNAEDGKPDPEDKPDNTTTPTITPTGESEKDKKEREKAAKEREKAAKEELKRLNELEASKIAIMDEGHEKDLALIRLNYKKKLDAIRGNGETEEALRVQLAKECEQAVADCETKYQKELARINLENRLASVEKGSKAERDIKLAQIQAARAAEMEAAEKNGADVTLIDAKYNKQRAEVNEAYAQAIVAQEEKKLADIKSATDAAYIVTMNSLKQRYAKEMAEAKGDAAKQAAIKARYDKEEAELSERYAQQTVQDNIDMLESILKQEDLTAAERLKIEKLLADKKIELAGLVADAAVAAAERTTKADDDSTSKRLANAKQWLQVAADSLNTISDLVATVYDAKISKVEEEQEVNTEAGEAEQERIAELVEQKVITEEEGEARKRAAEDKTAKKNEELERKKQQLKYRQAVWDKANGIAQAGIATALAIMNALQMKPFPVGIAMAAIAGALGAVQVASIIATPIPKYAKGTDRHKGGLAIVGDGGTPELVVHNGKSWVTPDEPTLVDLPAGAIVLPDISLAPDKTGLVEIPEGGNNTPPVIVNNDYGVLQREVAQVCMLIRMLLKQQRRSSRDLELQQYIQSKI